MWSVGKRNKSRGYTLVMVLAATVVTSVLAERAIYVTSKRHQRNAEEELLFRGLAIQHAIQSYYDAGNPVKQFPKRLEDLLVDPRFTQKRHLRKLTLDPITQTEWDIIPAIDGGIAGVHSKSKATPIKQANFPEAIMEFSGAAHYDDWRFEYKPATTIQKSKTKTTRTGHIEPLHIHTGTQAN